MLMEKNSPQRALENTVRSLNIEAMILKTVLLHRRYVLLDSVIYPALRLSSTCSGLGRRPVPSPCTHALLLESMRNRQAHRSSIKTTAVEVVLQAIIPSIDVRDFLQKSIQTFVKTNENGDQNFPAFSF